jgi:hypothetical protein
LVHKIILVGASEISNDPLQEQVKDRSIYKDKKIRIDGVPGLLFKGRRRTISSTVNFSYNHNGKP